MWVWYGFGGFIDRYGHEVTAGVSLKMRLQLYNGTASMKVTARRVVPPTIKFTADISIVRDADIVMFVIPSKFVREVAKR